MRYLTPLDRRRRTRRHLLMWSVFLFGLIVLTLSDRAIFNALRVPNRAALESGDWYHFLRSVGYLPTWLAVGAALIAADLTARRREPARRGALTMAGALFGGLAAELLKVFVARQRPINNGFEDGAYVWGYPFEAFAGGGNYGLASSHTGVAFGAAFVLARVAPGSGPIVMLLAGGCALLRMLSGAHFATDVYVAIWMSAAISTFLCDRFPEPEAR